MGSALYQDEDFLVINKPAGLHSESEEIQALFKIPSNFQAVHRLDKDTSGCLLFAREDLVLPTRELFKDKEAVGLRKIYLVGLPEKPPKAGIYKGYCGSRYRSSQKVHFGYQKRDLQGFRSIVPVEHEILETQENFPYFKGFLCKVRLITGARHQIRSFFATLNKPILGDALYSESPGNMELHAYELEWKHPFNGKTYSVKATTLPSPHKELKSAE